MSYPFQKLPIDQQRILETLVESVQPDGKILVADIVNQQFFVRQFGHQIVWGICEHGQIHDLGLCLLPGS